MPSKIVQGEKAAWVRNSTKYLYLIYNKGESVSKFVYSLRVYGSYHEAFAQSLVQEATVSALSTEFEKNKEQTAVDVACAFYRKNAFGHGLRGCGSGWRFS